MIEVSCPRCAYCFKSEEETTLSENEYLIEDNCPECDEYIVMLFSDDKLVDYR